jgi:hypothetical protein
MGPGGTRSCGYRRHQGADWEVDVLSLISRAVRPREYPHGNLLSGHVAGLQRSDIRLISVNQSDALSLYNKHEIS